MEIKFLEALQILYSPILNYLMIFITYLGNGGFIWIVAAIYLLFQNNNKLKREAFTLALALIIFSIFGLLILKPIIARPRPFTVSDVNLLIKEPLGFSFPSGHTGSSFAAAYVIYFYNKKKGVLALILAALIAFSRMYLFVHYPTDIIAGIILGLISGKLATNCTNNLLKRAYNN
ncbi:phosphatase PAP2 family protein [Peptoniphilus sp. AGMB00490]|uniref:Phosphatase PAP2 family protein n=1 Tax=Peptoniphilus faecalis TaxID=2731255 RepID=A0A848RLN5_9FIRM|nr:phosphatase PAP2 family protein [Peptoniphilus faecalis]NMW85054.1 phosphatase PAP2 family protein [Peptoniphilus faecalis]